MSNTQTLTRSPSITAPKTDKTKKQSRVVILRLPSDILSRFVEKPAVQESESPTSDAPSPAVATTELPTLKIEQSTDAASESNSTPAPPQDPSNPTESTKKRKGPAPGSKRSTPMATDGMPKPRGKPGPKKKPRLEDGTIDHSAKPSAPTAPGHKLGPKANQGAINAGLRALDRSGKPCRKWTRKAFQLKSFTGVVWEVPSWKGGQMVLINGDDSSDTKEISQQSSSEMKPNGSDVAMSNADDNPDAMAMSTPAASSPPAAPSQPNGIVT